MTELNPSADIPPDDLHHVVLDVSTGAVTYVLLTRDEVAEHHARVASEAEEHQRQRQESAALAEQVANHPDPLVRLLAQRSGLV